MIPKQIQDELAVEIADLLSLEEIEQSLERCKDKINGTNAGHCSVCLRSGNYCDNCFYRKTALELGVISENQTNRTCEAYLTTQFYNSDHRFREKDHFRQAWRRYTMAFELKTMIMSEYIEACESIRKKGATLREQIRKG